MQKRSRYARIYALAAHTYVRRRKIVKSVGDGRRAGLHPGGRERYEPPGWLYILPYMGIKHLTPKRFRVMLGPITTPAMLRLRHDLDHEMALSTKQMEFAQCVAKLLLFVHDYADPDTPGVRFGVTFGDAYRDPRVFGQFGGSMSTYSSKRSVHKLRLAIDLNLFRVHPDNSTMFMRTSKDHEPFGEYWQTLHKDARWGGTFKRPDGNHYSFSHWGVA